MPRVRPTLLLAALLLLTPPAALAGKCPKGECEFQFFWENDAFSGSDRYYTNGIKFGFGADVEVLKQVFKPASEGLLEWISAAGGHVHFGLFAGQNLYTPRDIKIPEAQPLDRPWAAWAYLGGVAQRVNKDRLDTVEIDLGMVGPAALGKPVQTEWHRLVGAPQPRGWSHQLPNEPAFLASWLHKERHRLGGKHFELIPHWGATVGTVLTLARAGAMLRFGEHMSGFGPDTIEPGGAMLGASRDSEPCPGRTLCEWYGFLSADYRLVAHNIFLDGTVFRDSPGVDHRVGVHDLAVGVSARFERFRLSLTRVERSEEFTSAAGGGGRQTFHSLNVTYSF